MNERTERAVFWWILLGVLAAFWAILALFFWPQFADADDTVTMACDPPTHRVQNYDCDQQGTPITAAEIDTITYTFSYRQVGTANWINVESASPSVALTLAGYGVTYEATVGARFPGGAILCTTDLITYTTGPDTSPPGPCSAFGISKVVP